MTTDTSKYSYQVGGSLNVNSPTYVMRKADDQIYQALVKGEFCYVFNCRQMGKSSLRVQVKHRLQQENFACVSLDMTNIGSKEISPAQWYKSIASELWRGFNLIGKVKFKTWWSEQEGLSPLQHLSHFISDILLPNVDSEQIFIFIDEIDSVLSLDFPTDDFFALIRYFYNARAENKDFKRISFALFGVATPSDLIRDQTRTPFNIGTAIELTGFTISEASPLIAGLIAKFKTPETLLAEILVWTGGQPFLTQKVCKLVVDNCQQNCSCLVPELESIWLEKIVRKNIIDNWESQDEPEHIKTIRDRLLGNEAKASRYLGLYQQILQQGGLKTNESLEQRELLLTNLAIKKNEQLIVRNRIYQEIFNLEWVEKQLDRLRPYERMFKLWLASDGQDVSRLLQGKTLEDAQAWANNHSISQEEYQFLTISKEQEQEELRRDLELKRLKEVETRLWQEQKLAKSQRFLLSTISSALIVTLGLGAAVYWQFRQAKISEIEAHITSSRGLFDSDQRFDALLEILEAKQDEQELVGLDRRISFQIQLALRQAAYNVVEKNTFSGHRDIVNGVSFSPNGQLVASASSDTTVKLWQRDGKFLRTLKGHQDSVIDVAFSTQGNILASASEDNSLKLWSHQGELINTLVGHQGGVHRVVFSPQGDLIASASEDKTVRLWTNKGRLLKILAGTQQEVLAVCFSPDGNMIATGDRAGRIRLWHRSGQLLRTFPAHKLTIRGIDFSPDGQFLVTGGDDNVAKIWTVEGNLLKTLLGYNAPVTGVNFSPDGELIGTSSWDGTIKLWYPHGTLHSNLKGHQGRVWRLVWSPEGSTIASAGWDNVVKLWQIKEPLVTTFYGHNATVLSVAFHPQGKYIASTSVDRTVKLWRTDGTLITNFTGHTAEVHEVSFSPDGELIASTGVDRTIKLWKSDGEVVNTLTGHTAPVVDVTFVPNGESLISGGFDTKIRLWQLQNQGNKIGGTQKRILSGHQAIITDLDISKDGNLIASVSHDRYLKLWKRQSNQVRIIKSIIADSTGLRTVSISPDQQIIASGGKDQNVKLWTKNGELITILEGHQAIVLDVEFSPDGQQIASASADKTIKIWNREGKLLTTLRGHQGRVWNVAFSPDGQQIASAGEDKQVKLWDLERILPLDSLKYGCDWIKDYLSTNRNLNQQDNHSVCPKSSPRQS